MEFVVRSWNVVSYWVFTQKLFHQWNTFTGYHGGATTVRVWQQLTNLPAETFIVDTRPRWTTLLYGLDASGSRQWPLAVCICSSLYHVAQRHVPVSDALSHYVQVVPRFDVPDLRRERCAAQCELSYATHVLPAHQHSYFTFNRYNSIGHIDFGFTLKFPKYGLKLKIKRKSLALNRVYMLSAVGKLKISTSLLLIKSGPPKACFVLPPCESICNSDLQRNVIAETRKTRRFAARVTLRLT